MMMITTADSIGGSGGSPTIIQYFGVGGMIKRAKEAWTRRLLDDFIVEGGKPVDDNVESKHWPAGGNNTARFESNALAPYSNANLRKRFFYHPKEKEKNIRWEFDEKTE